MKTAIVLKELNGLKKKMQLVMIKDQTTKMETKE